MAKKAEKKKEKPKKKPQKKEPHEEKENFRGIVRIAGKDVKGHVKLVHSLLRVKGIGHTVAISASRIIQKELNIDPKVQVGELSEKQVEDIDKILFDLGSHEIKPYVLNRRNDFLTGNNKHVIMNDLIFDVSQDVDREKKMFTWKGFRHTFGQKVRGQRTKNTGRHGMAVGVLRKSVIAAAGAAAAKPEAKK